MSNFEDSIAPIAVVGLAGKFPGAESVDEFWENLINERESVSFFSDEELLKNDSDFKKYQNNPDYVKARAILKDVEFFDASFFDYSPREAASMDPQHRIWLEKAWEALENAGYCPEKFDGAIGVFAGSFVNSYQLFNLFPNRQAVEDFIKFRTPDAYQSLINNNSSFIPTRTSYKFNLTGPSVNIQTACSTSLVAISQACQSLWAYESDMCLAGGICVSVPQINGYLYQEGAIPSKDGHCRPFDAGANGTVFGNGVGIVVLKRYEDAIQDKDTIHALIRGIAINNDGSRKVSYMAPSVEGQSNVINTALSLANINPETIRYVEAHGTATPLGDPIEVSALSKAYTEHTTKKQYCGIGSLKSNVGHLDAAAGVAGLIKTVLALRSKQIPATLHYTKPNPQINFSESPFFVVDKTRDWEQDSAHPRRAAVSSLGIGGTNAHAILEESTDEITTGPSRPVQLILQSARTTSALRTAKENLKNHLKQYPETNIADLAYTHVFGRKDFEARQVIIAENSSNAVVQTIEEANSNFSPSGNSETTYNKLVFMFPGQGSIYPDVSKTLYKHEPVFREYAQRCSQIAQQYIAEDFCKELAKDSNLQKDDFQSTNICGQTLLFSIEYAMAKLLESWGIEPYAYIGHSLGEWTAACLSGVMTLEEAVYAVYHRGRLFQTLERGIALIVGLSANEAQAYLVDGANVSANNSPSFCLISGKEEQISACEKNLDKDEIFHKRHRVGVAVHSSSLDPIIEPFAELIKNINFKTPQQKIVSTVTGTWLTDEQATDPMYWAMHMRKPVQFSPGIECLLQEKNCFFLEVGPGNALYSLVNQHNLPGNGTQASNTLEFTQEDNTEYKALFTALGRLWIHNFKIDWEAFYSGEERGRIPLPTYPFERKKYWVSPVLNSDEKKDTDLNYELPISTTVNSSDPENSDGSRNNLLGKVQRLLSELSGFDTNRLNPESKFTDLGLDSLFLTQFARHLEKKFNVKVEFRQLIHDYPNLNSLCGLLQQLLGLTEDDRATNSINGRFDSSSIFKNFAPIQPKGSKDAFVMVHGDNANNFLPNHFGSDQPYLGFLHPGSDGEAIEYSSVTEMAAFYVEELLQYKPDGPYILGGFSFGGVLAYEMALQLIEKGKKIEMLALVDSGNPLAPIRFKWHKSLYKKLTSNILGYCYHGIKTISKRLVCKAYITIKKPIPIVFRRFYILDTYHKLWIRYKPAAYDGDIILFRAIGNKSEHKYLGWESKVNNIDLVLLEGNHQTIINTPETIEIIKNKLADELNKIQK